MNLNKRPFVKYKKKGVLMKKMFKKITAMTMVLTMLFTLSVSALAADISSEPMTTTINEYDVYIQQKAISSDKHSVIDINGNTEKTIEELYLERANLSEEELISQFGYSQEQISILKAYDGSPIENNPQLRAISATYTRSISKVVASRTKISAKLQWECSQRPISFSINKYDSIVCDVIPFDSSGSRKEAWTIENSSSIYTVSYAGFQNGIITKTNTYNVQWLTNGKSGADFSYYAASQFPQGIDLPEYPDNSPFWAKKGTMIVAVIPPDNAYTFNSVVFGFSYVTQGIIVNTTIGLTGGLSMSYTGTDILLEFVSVNFTYGDKEKFKNIVTITYTGQITNH